MSIQSIGTALPQNILEASQVLRDSRAAAPSTARTERSEVPGQAASKEELTAAVANVRDYIEPINNALEFSLNEETNQMVVKIIDRDTQEVIRQMPSEEMIAIAKALDSLKGLLLKQKA